MKKVLQVIKRLSRKIGAVTMRLEHFQNLRASVVPKLDGLPKSTDVKQEVERIALAITDLQARRDQLTSIMLACRIELFELLTARLPAELSQVLFYRYGMLKKFQEIMSELHYSESTIYRLHRRGLRKLGVKGSLADDYEFDS